MKLRAVVKFGAVGGTIEEVPFGDLTKAAEVAAAVARVFSGRELEQKDFRLGRRCTLAGWSDGKHFVDVWRHTTGQ